MAWIRSNASFFPLAPRALPLLEPDVRIESMGLAGTFLANTFLSESPLQVTSSFKPPTPHSSWPFGLDSHAPVLLNGGAMAILVFPDRTMLAGFARINGWRLHPCAFRARREVLHKARTDHVAWVESWAHDVTTRIQDLLEPEADRGDEGLEAPWLPLEPDQTCAEEATVLTNEALRAAGWTGKDVWIKGAVALGHGLWLPPEIDWLDGAVLTPACHDVARVLAFCPPVPLRGLANHGLYMADTIGVVPSGQDLFANPTDAPASAHLRLARAARWPERVAAAVRCEENQTCDPQPW